VSAFVQAQAAHRETRGEVVELHRRWQMALEDASELGKRLESEERLVEEARLEAADARATVRCCGHMQGTGCSFARPFVYALVNECMCVRACMRACVYKSVSMYMYTLSSCVC